MSAINTSCGEQRAAHAAANEPPLYIHHVGKSIIETKESLPCILLNPGGEEFCSEAMPMAYINQSVESFSPY